MFFVLRNYSSNSVLKEIGTQNGGIFWTDEKKHTIVRYGNLRALFIVSNDSCKEFLPFFHFISLDILEVMNNMQNFVNFMKDSW